MTFAEICKALSIKQPSAIPYAKSIDQPFIKSNHLLPKDKTIKTTDFQTSDTTTDHDSRQYKYPIPKLTPEHVKKNDLSVEDEARLERQFYLAKLALHEFKNYMRAQGVNVENFDITITNNRINYSKIPDTYRGIFEIMFKNNLSADSFKARNTHKSLSSFFNQAPGYTKNLFSPHPNLLNPKNISGNNSSPLDLKNISLNNSNQLNSNNISLNHANLLNPENNLSLLRMR